MLKLKLRMLCPFKGYGVRLIAIAGVAAAVMGMTFFFCFDALITGIGFGLLLTVIGWIWWSGRLTAEDRAYMDMAEYPLWMPLTEEDRARLEKRSDHTWVIYALIIMLLLLFFHFPDSRSAPRTPDGWELWRMFEVLTIIAVTVTAVFSSLNGREWNHVDETACVAEFPVRYRYTLTEHTRTGEIISNYLVFYLPDGKYVLSQNGDHCDRVRIVKYKGMLTYIEVDDRPWSKDNILKRSTRSE